MDKRGRYLAIGLIAGTALGAGFVASQQLLHPDPPPQTDTPTEPTIPQEVVVGEWKNTIGSWSQTIRIIVHAGLIMHETALPNGEVDRDILTEVDPEGSEQRRFINPSSTHDQSYAITRYGHLALYDRDGYVGQALNVSTQGDAQ